MSNPDSKEAVLAHNKLVKDTWDEMQSLAMETEALLSTCKVKKAKTKTGMKTGNARDHFDATKTGGKKGATVSMDDSGLKGTGGGKGKKGKSLKGSTSMKGSQSTTKLEQQQHAKTQRLDMALSLEGPMFDKTRDLYAESMGRVTVEVLDDASPDVTPRGEEEEKRRSDRIEALAKTAAHLQNMKETESIYRKNDFDGEKARILANSDIFVSAPGVSAGDVEKERLRLNKLEEAARKHVLKREKEENRTSANLQGLRAVMLLQKIYRGHLGRRKFRLSQRLQILEKKEAASTELVWIEVRDRESGDVWYYNKGTGLSQWEKPDDMFSVIAPKENIKSLPAGHDDGKKNPTSHGGGHQESKSDKLKINMALPSKAAVSKGKSALSFEEKKKQNEQERKTQENAQNEVNSLIGVDKIRANDSLFAPDGTFRPKLRTTVQDALLETRFDNVSTVLSDRRWLEQNKDPFQKPAGVNPHAGAKVDKGKKAMVSTMKLGKKDKSKEVNVKNDNQIDLEREHLTVTDLQHPGFNDGDGNKEVSIERKTNDDDDNGPFIPGTMCFGCWSSGAKRNCALHTEGDAKVKPSETMLLCRNWELGVMRRRYRSEEIQEIFMKKGSSLRYDVKRKAFLTVVEQRHQIYRGLKNLVDKFNFRMLLWMKIKRWLNSLADEVRSKPVSKQSKERVAMMRMRRTLTHAFQLTNLLVELRDGLPVPPITGTTWPERTGEIQFLFKRSDQASGQEVELIMAYPVPPNKTLYKPRVYHISLPKSIPMPKPAYIETKIENIHAQNNFIHEDNKANWFEKMARAVSGSVVTKQPPPSTIKFATKGKKPVPENLAVGGLPLELLVYQLISTYVPAQYGGLVVMDKSTVSPGVSPEILITFQSALHAPINQAYVFRALEHPLNYRRAPTVTANSAVEPDDKYYYGRNRPDQTGEQEPHGFRTTCWAKYVVVKEAVDTSAFTPGPEVVSLNVPASNVSVTTHADHTYPFCEPSTRDNSTLDFFHLLLQGAISGSKAQVFTALTVQEPGLFLKECNANLPLGHLVVNIYRSWAFTQKDTIEEFKTDDGVPYWYHRRTGQTFWERPLHEEEAKTALEGGTILDQRRQDTHVASRIARDRGVLPGLPEDKQQSMIAHQRSVDTVGTNKTGASSPARQAAPPPAGQNRLGSALDAEPSMVNGQGGSLESSPSRGSAAGGIQNPANLNKTNQIKVPDMPGMAVAGVSPEAMQGLTGVMAEMMGKLSAIGSSGGNPADMLQIGMSMGMALLGSGAGPGFKQKTDRFSSRIDASAGESGISGEVLPLPIGTSKKTEAFSTNKELDRFEKDRQANERRKLLEDPLTALEAARGLRVEQDVTDTPDIAPEKVMTNILPKNAEEGMKEAGVVCMVYPELSTLVSPDGPPANINEHAPAGLGTSFVKAEDADNQLRVKGSDILRKSVVPLPVGFFNAIIAKHIAKQDVDYLPMVPNLPQARTVGRVKPRSSAIDWLAISFDPWSAGKPPLSFEFIASLAAKAENLFGKDSAGAHDELDKLRDTTSQAEQRALITKDQLLAADFERVCSLCRHAKFSEVETMVNQPDWNVPVDYQNDMGNTLLHVVAQNGNKRLVKLCMRRGADLNGQNLTGQTALHFAFGYGYTEVGDYLVKKGADDSIRNKDGLTCYEGLGGAELNLL
eukprot:GSChrysophyteH2.ASY1.ANO1.1443.1 assembled CDS